MCARTTRDNTFSVACSFRDRLSDDEVGKAHAWGTQLAKRFGRVFVNKLQIQDTVYLLNTLEHDDYANVSTGVTKTQTVVLDCSVISASVTRVYYPYAKEMQEKGRITVYHIYPY
eukprot:m.274396 g.274396  ORF g.274396 m.274396 type:complete len:115 (+) comp16288_c1_seq1:69-413(+)